MACGFRYDLSEKKKKKDEKSMDLSILVDRRGGASPTPDARNAIPPFDLASDSGAGFPKPLNTNGGVSSEFGMQTPPLGISVPVTDWGEILLQCTRVYLVVAQPNQHTCTELELRISIQNATLQVYSSPQPELLPSQT